MPFIFVYITLDNFFASFIMTIFFLYDSIHMKFKNKLK